MAGSWCARVIAMMCSAWLSWRSPPRLSRYWVRWPEEHGIGTLPDCSAKLASQRGRALCAELVRVDRDLPALGDQRLRCRAVALVPSAAGRLAVRLVADVIGQLGLHRPLDQALGQLRQNPAGPGDLLLGRGAGEQLVDEFGADPPIGRQVESLSDPAAARGPIHRLIDYAGWQDRGARRPSVSSSNSSALLSISLLLLVVVGIAISFGSDAYTEGRTLPLHVLATKLDMSTEKVTAVQTTRHSGVYRASNVVVGRRVSRLHQEGAAR